MRLLLIPLLSLAVSAFAAPPGAVGKHLFILSGQSNMARLDVGAYFTPHVEAQLGRGQVIVVKDADGGQPIRRWLGGTDDLYGRLLRKVGRAIGDEAIQSVTFIWMQGEKDARSGLSATYARALAELLSRLETDLGRGGVNVVIGRLSDYGLDGPGRSHWQRIREIQVRFAESRPRGAWVDTDDLNDGRDQEGDVVHNDLHLTPAGYSALGARFAARALELLQGEGVGYRPASGPGSREGAATGRPPFRHKPK